MNSPTGSGFWRCLSPVVETSYWTRQQSQRALHMRTAAVCFPVPLASPPYACLALRSASQKDNCFKWFSVSSLGGVRFRTAYFSLSILVAPVRRHQLFNTRSEDERRSFSILRQTTDVYTVQGRIDVLLFSCKNGIIVNYTDALYELFSWLRVMHMRGCWNRSRLF